MNEHLLKSLFGIEHPIIQGPMAGDITTPTLVSSVCNANALGFLAAGYIRANVLQNQIEQVKAKTLKPFGINLFITNTISNCIKNKQQALIHLEKEINLNSDPSIPIHVDEEIDKKIDLIIEQNIPVVSFTFGTPNKTQIERLRKKKVFLVGTACNITEALTFQELDFDAVVMQGIEAGGHRGSSTTFFQSDEIGLLALLQDAKKMLKIPYFAAGAISSGDAILSCKILGPQAVQIGTGFLLTRESGASVSYKKAISSAKAENTTITPVISGKKARAVVNKLIKDLSTQHENIEIYPIQNSLTKDLRTFANKNNLSEYQSLYCGQGIQCLTEQSVEEFIARLLTEYYEAYNKLR